MEHSYNPTPENALVQGKEKRPRIGKANWKGILVTSHGLTCYRHSRGAVTYTKKREHKMELEKIMWHKF